ncbi:hypothetical protein PHMEG_00014478 [Phytophthora megakarya]|uniref:Integrase zinc-binding domain-containing protein n=1 Tax=Phytophthora megakarya TaxID=4795 RepID=A0A225W3P5_9STRA|nr:hypothetical protein PHMEG_00014478 [Phytophthora megakarya]
MEEMYIANNNPECAMNGPVLREHQQKDKMNQQIHTACLAGTNNPDYRLLPYLAYHQNLRHPGGTRQYKTMRQMFYSPGMDTMITKFCHKCQTCKSAKVHGGKQGYGKLPPRTLKTVDPFDIVYFDLIR